MQLKLNKKFTYNGSANNFYSDIENLKLHKKFKCKIYNDASFKIKAKWSFFVLINDEMPIQDNNIYIKGKIVSDNGNRLNITLSSVIRPELWIYLIFAAVIYPIMFYFISVLPMFLFSIPALLLVGSFFVYRLQEKRLMEKFVKLMKLK